ncbi:MAG: phosphohydrolase [Nitrospinae bacterium CG11_big_fil_rev_8_21_14_0_20_56_8]|nr:MAG: phosphohydrolase [Nitrospinae bacterium CG11_big_fil_rev_8_21_14_0_20_56_8]
MIKYEKNMSIDAREIVEDWVSSTPAVYLKLKEALDDPESSFRELADIISADAALTARLLKIVNSPFYGFSSKIETISHALKIVGTEQLCDLVLAATVMNQFRDVPRELVTMESFWRHSIACGMLARSLARERGELNAERYYVGGMLHDIGSLVIYKKSPKKALELLGRCHEEEKHLYEVEPRIFGFDHGDVGKALLEAWNLPPSLVEAVSFHHLPGEATLDPGLTQIVHVADILAYEMKMGSSGEPFVPPFDEETLKELGLSNKSLKELSQNSHEEIEQAIQMFL